jgi:hypothetical protein
MEQRPAAMHALDPAQVASQPGFQRGVGLLAEEVHHQDVFGRNGGVGFELVDPVAVGLLLFQHRAERALDRPVQPALARFGLPVPGCRGGRLCRPER